MVVCGNIPLGCCLRYNLSCFWDQSYWIAIVINVLHEFFATSCPRPLSDVQMSRCWSSVTDFDVESVALIAGRGSSGREAYVAGNLEEKWVFYRRKKFIKFEEDWTTRLGTSGRRNAEMKKCMCVLSRKWPKISSKRRQQDWLQRAPDSCWEDPRTFWAWDQEEAEAIALIGMTKTPGPTRRQG